MSASRILLAFILLALGFCLVIWGVDVATADHLAQPPPVYYGRVPTPMPLPENCLIYRAWEDGSAQAYCPDTNTIWVKDPDGDIRSGKQPGWYIHTAKDTQ